MLVRVSRRIKPPSISAPIRNYSSILNVLKKKLPADLAMEHFDAVYKKVYQKKWPSIRLGLLYGTKYCAVVNPYAEPEQTFEDLKLQGAIELREFYLKQTRRIERYKLRMNILEEKRAKKLAILAEKRGVKPEEIQSDIEVSDVSDSEVGGGTTTDPEMYKELFETDIEAMRRKEGFMHEEAQNVDLYDFVPCTEMIYEEAPAIVDLSLQYNPEALNLDVEMVEVDKLEFPDNLKVFTFPRGSLLTFEPPKASGVSCLNNYYLVDGGHILPLITLNIQPNEKVADLCAAPGGKALAAMFTMKPSVLFCTDKNEANFLKMRNFFDSYLPKLDSLRNSIYMEKMEAQDIDCPGAFDKVLVDPPSTFDRFAVCSNFTNMFKPSRVQERLAVPDKQKSLLKCGLRLLKPGGSLVYSTSSLSPIQNDFVIQAALSEMSTESGMQFTIDALKEAYRPLRALYRMYTFKYGIQILPFLPSNFGPTYLAKINRKE